MLTREEKKQWLIDNCLDEEGQINLSNLDLSGYKLDISCIKADEIQQSNQKAEEIYQSYHKANIVVQNQHTAEIIHQERHTVELIQPFNLRGYRKIHTMYTNEPEPLTQKQIEARLGHKIKIVEKEYWHFN